MIKYLFIALLVMIGYSLALLVPMNSALTLVMIGCIIVLTAVAYVLYLRLREVIWWIKGRPGGFPGQQSPGVHLWIQKSEFHPPIQGLNYSPGGDPDGVKPIDPPPQDI